jgi:hypothetical protein
LPLQKPFDKTEDTKKRAPVTSDTISRFNRDTVWLATGVLGTVIFAALVLAVQDHQPNVTQADRNRWLNASPARDSIAIPIGSYVNGEITPEPENSVDQEFAANRLQEIPSQRRNLQLRLLAPVLAFPPELSRNAHGQDSARLSGTKPRNAINRSSLAFGSVDVKRRLIELWHQSLAKSEKSRSWTAFSHLNRVESKKAAYTAETNH